MPQPVRIGFLLYPDLNQLDVTGPYEVFSRVPEAEVHLAAKSLESVRADSGLRLLPTTTLETCPPLALLCVPGGLGVEAVLSDHAYLAFLRRMAAGARYVTSVCTGALALGAAGLLADRRATTHWLSRPLLPAFGAELVDKRVVVDGPLITGGGVTAGIDFALRVVAELHGTALAEAIQLAIEYNPDPPFSAGSPASAGPEVVADVEAAARQRMRRLAEQVDRAAAALSASAT